MTSTQLPKHIGFVMDGNRRWAEGKGLRSTDGHKEGYESFRRISEACLDRDINVATFWAFSTENWKRPKKEIIAIMKLLKYALRTEVKRFMARGVRFNAIGRIAAFPFDIRREIKHAIEETKENTKAVLNIGLNYGGREEIVDAIKNIVKQGFSPSRITAQLVNQFMYAPHLPEPDLIIRTSGEQRSSGFMLWQAPYAEWLYSKKLWPDYSEVDLDQALAEYRRRKRNFGA